VETRSLIGVSYLHLLRAMDNEPLTPNRHLYLAEGGNNSVSESITSFLGYMQRRLSDFIASDSQADGEGQQTHAHDSLALAHNSAELPSSLLKESPSVHRAGCVFHFLQLYGRVLCAQVGSRMW